MTDITRQSSFQNVETWLKELRDHADNNITLMLVGNKSDLAETSRAVTTDEAKDYASEGEMLFFETSALDSTNVDVAFQTVFERVYETVPKTMAQDNEAGNLGAQNTIKLKPPTAGGESGRQDEAKSGGGCC